MPIKYPKPINDQSQSLSEPNFPPVRTSIAQSQLMMELKEKCIEYTKLKFGWDGYDGIAVPLASANLAIQLIEKLVSPSVPEPSIVPGGDGAIQIEWHEKKYHLEIEIFNPLAIGILLIKRNTRKMFESELNLSDENEEKIYSVLSGYVNKLLEK